MKHPEKWRETEDPFKLPYKNFILTEVLGYPHAGNDVFHAKGIYQQREVEVFIKVAKQMGADIKNEIEVINCLNYDNIPQIIDFDEKKEHFVVTLAMTGERLSTIVGEKGARISLEYLYEYGMTLAKLHGTVGKFSNVKDRRFFHVPEKEYFDSFDLGFVYEYLIENEPKTINKCFCHGDFHYANILWENKHMSAILDFELSGVGSREFDIAWALILRPGQKFLNSKQEIELFLEGYKSQESFNEDYVKYYMILIYSYFYKIGRNESGYQKYVMTVFEDYCKDYK